MAIRLDELRARLEAAEGPDRQIDEDLDRTVREWPVLGGYYGWTQSGPGCVSRPTNSEGTRFETMIAPYYTSSLDAAIALVEAKLPGWHRVMDGSMVDFLYEGQPADNVTGFRYYLLPPLKNGSRDGASSMALHKSEPIALLLALLSALKENTQ